MFFGEETIGPVSDTLFLQLIQQGEIDRESIVQSPQLTSNQDIEAGKLNLPLIRQIQQQRIAELLRLDNVTKRLEAKQNKNRGILRNGVKQAIADGRVTLQERTQLFEFADKAGIPRQELELYLSTESSELLRETIEEFISDGLLDATEKAKISQLAVGLGISVSLNDDQKFRLELCEYAWKVLNGQSENSENGSCNVELFEIVALKRPMGIAVGDDHYLKSILTGAFEFSDKQVLLNGKFATKKYALNSIADVQWYADGLFCRRTTGKSLFIAPQKFGIDWCKFAIRFQSFVTGQPVLGIPPEDSFIPVSAGMLVANPPTNSQANDNSTDDSANDSWQPSARHARYTFRVVGEQFENRSDYLDQLHYNDTVLLKREPNNAYDIRAVAVTDIAGNKLGYLKREVSDWFAPILDRGKKFRCEVFRKVSSGGIVISLYE